MPRHAFSREGLLVAVAVAAAALGAIAATAPSARPAACRPVRQLVPTPRAPSAFLWRIAVAPDGTVWAVGDADRGTMPGVVFRLRGGRFIQVPVPRGTEELRGIVAPTAQEAWAIAMNGILRWDGERWSRSSAPVASYLSISADAPDDVWAVGTTGGGLLVVRWNGKTWKRVPFDGQTVGGAGTLPGRGGFVGFSYLEGVFARAADDVWVGGNVGTAHWNGRNWRWYPTPHPHDDIGSFAELSPGDVWAAGSLRGGDRVYEWTGGTWRERGFAFWIPDLVVRRAELWAILYDVVARWGGSNWVPLEQRHQQVALKGLAVDAAGNVWAAGYRLGSVRGQRAIVYRYHCAP